MTRHVFFAALGFLVAGCSDKAENSHATAVAHEPIDANQIAVRLKAARIPVSNLKIVTEANDDNHLLGRPNQYTSKVFFYDARHPKAEGEDNENTIEVFASGDDAKARHDYIENVTKGVPMLLQYQILNGTTLVRLSKSVLPSEVEGYKKALGVNM